MTADLRLLRVADPAEALAACCRLAYAQGLCPGLAGNASVRLDDGFLCTPSGCCLGEIEPGDLVLLDASGLARDPRRRRTSEWPLHAHIYGAGPARSVLHTHSAAAVVLACQARGLEPLTPEMAHFLGTVPCLPFAPPGTDDVGRGVAGALGDGARAALLERHGAVVWANDVRGAFFQAQTLEAACALTVALQSGSPAGGQR